MIVQELELPDLPPPGHVNEWPPEAGLAFQTLLDCAFLIAWRDEHPIRVLHRAFDVLDLPENARWLIDVALSGIWGQFWCRSMEKYVDAQTFVREGLPSDYVGREGDLAEARGLTGLAADQ